MEMALVFQCCTGFDACMKEIFQLLLVGLLAVPANADERPLLGAQILEQLNGKSFQQVRPTTTRHIEQIFQVGGATQFVVDGQYQHGLWKVEGNKYCSSWPPAEDWDCYDLLQDGTTIVFLSSRGARYVMVPTAP